MVASEADLITRLDALGIAHKTHRHPAVFTVEEAKALRGELQGAHCKSLFLKDRRDGLWLAVMLEHRDQSLSVPLMVATGAENDIVAEWQRWARVLGLPLLIPDGEGEFREAFDRIGAVRVNAPVPRRRRGTLRQRRPSILMRRKPGRRVETPPMHRGEREIIARN